MLLHLFLFVLTDNTNLATVKALAIDMTKTTNGEDFVLGAGDSVSAHSRY